jgi:arylsulfatase A-like enzyme
MGSRNQISRRELLKLASLVPLAWATQLIGETSIPEFDQNIPNVIILVFDAWSARHLPMYGYPRATMPNLEKFAQRSTIFHRHYSTATFTVPGTASLLTGLHPWSHRAICLESAGVLERYVDQQIFACFYDTHFTLGFSQNHYSDLFLYQFKKYLKLHERAGTFNLEHSTLYNSPLFENDARLAFSSFQNNIFRRGPAYDSSLFVGPVFQLWRLHERSVNTAANHERYPRGLPDAAEQFLLDDVVNGVTGLLRRMKQPAFSYLHFYPPHSPYAAGRQYENRFDDHWTPQAKPMHVLSRNIKPEVLNQQNDHYDEYLANWDDELETLFDYLHSSGLFDNSYIIITSDHGEIFERGETGHFTPLIYEPLIHVPLIISSPGQTHRQDVHAPTSSVDILPTLTHLAGMPVPNWTEGKLLPLFGGTEDPDRSIFAMDAKRNSAFKPLTEFSLSLTKGDYRLTYYQYPETTKFEFYDLKEDPEELNDLHSSHLEMEARMKNELLQKLSEVNKPFES